MIIIANSCTDSDRKLQELETCVNSTLHTDDFYSSIIVLEDMLFKSFEIEEVNYSTYLHLLETRANRSFDENKVTNLKESKFVNEFDVYGAYCAFLGCVNRMNIVHETDLNSVWYLNYQAMQELGTRYFVYTITRAVANRISEEGKFDQIENRTLLVLSLYCYLLSDV